MIGGFGWKVRFVGTDGYIITGDAGDTTQYNLANGTWVAYHAGEQTPYDCGSCHTTGYREEGHQDGLDGIVGTWAMPGIQCEECHGAGSNHTAAPYEADMKVIRDQEQCGSCHVRGDPNLIPAKGGFIEHHEQYNEVLSSKHTALDCVDCHNPHRSVKFEDAGAKDRGYGIKNNCESCHLQQTQATPEWVKEYHNCVDCHMQYMVKSAVGDADGRRADIRSHVFKINTDPEAEQFYEQDGKTYAYGYQTLEYTCLTSGCHIGQKEDWAAALAGSIHRNEDTQPVYMGSDACAKCHGEIYEKFVKTGHPYKLNKAADAQMGDEYYPWLDTFGITDIPLPIVRGVQMNWFEVSYVIGGFGWKARFLDQDGYIMTGIAGDETQYNLDWENWEDLLGPGADWSAYHAGEVTPYDCGSCHTTGYSETGHQDNRPGIVGTWAFPGIQCEACHGPAGNHVLNPPENRMIVDNSNEACGSCHNRGGLNDTVIASGGFIQHHEQYNELAAGGDKMAAGMKCTICHDPHASAKFEPELAIKAECANCHRDEAEAFEGWSEAEHHDCLDCHMPRMVKSALGSATHRTADMRSHLFEINTDIGDDQFNGGESYPYITLEYSCLTSGCHFGQTEAWAQTEAANVHD
ncbi:MAG: multiheme c-type cytochrome [Deltaproteobacteria bacterium]|nr:multiheme c-type cytochrome [Deltaproteobacteria bacterium]